MIKLLSSSQLVRSILWGAALWFFAALLLRYLGPLGIFDGFARVVLYALVIPGTIPFVWATPNVTGTDRSQLVLSLAAADAAALLLDGMAVAWLPILYGAERSLILGSAAVILWGAGIVLMLAFIMQGKQAS
ncbi:MAG: hypothetical protein AAF768_07375 [Pseudomonadota bacterium]